jgi:hypothetical protein
MSAKASGAQTLWQYSQAGQLLFAWKGPTTQTTHEYVYLAGSLVATIDHAWPSNAITATKCQRIYAKGRPLRLHCEEPRVWNPPVHALVNLECAGLVKTGRASPMLHVRPPRPRRPASD